MFGPGFARLAFVGALFAVSVARADETATITGVVSSGVDAGQPFVLQFYVATDPQELAAVGASQTFQPPKYSNMSWTYYTGFSPFGFQLTIGSAPPFSDPYITSGEVDRYAQASGHSELAYSEYDYNYGAGSLSVWADISSSTDPFVTNYDYRYPLTHVISSSDAASGGFQIIDPPYPDVNDGLLPQSITIVSDQVPETGAWLLMLLGTAAIGVAFRRRRQGAYRGSLSLPSTTSHLSRLSNG